MTACPIRSRIASIALTRGATFSQRSSGGISFFPWQRPPPEFDGPNTMNSSALKWAAPSPEKKRRKPTIWGVSARDRAASSPATISS